MQHIIKGLILICTVDLRLWNVFHLYWIEFISCESNFYNNTQKVILLIMSHGGVFSEAREEQEHKVGRALPHNNRHFHWSQQTCESMGLSIISPISKGKSSSLIHSESVINGLYQIYRTFCYCHQPAQEIVGKSATFFHVIFCYFWLIFFVVRWQAIMMSHDVL